MELKLSYLEVSSLIGCKETQAKPSKAVMASFSSNSPPPWDGARLVGVFNLSSRLKSEKSFNISVSSEK